MSVEAKNEHQSFRTYTISQSTELNNMVQLTEVTGSPGLINHRKAIKL